MKTVTLDYPNLGKALTVTIDDEGHLTNQHWSTTMPDTDTTAINVDPNEFFDPGDEGYESTHPEPPVSLTSEQQIVQQYHSAVKSVAYYEGLVDAAKDSLREAKAEKSRLYKVASVIDPSLKQTRPKSDA